MKVQCISIPGTRILQAAPTLRFDPQDTLALDDEALDTLRTAVPDYTSNTMGIRVGGPIIKDKAFSS